ncbi:MAG: BamA/TamA family outer membrane protein [Silicimonas sp.]|nr:BamA/TamA family outer membrane protein [Silicimonas sp.]
MIWLVTAFSAASETRIQFAAPGASDSLRDALRGASQTLREGGKATAQDLLAAAQSDYAQLLGVLYSRARYGGVILIRVDGREAASIPPLAQPTEIRTIQIQVNPGPVFLFDDARIGPLARGTELPEGFRRGQPAGTQTIQDAADAGVDGWRAAGHAKANVAAEEIIARHAQDRVSARIGLNPGPRLRFGNVTVGGSKDVSARRIRIIAGIPEGQVYDPAEVERAAARLRRTGSFRSVTIEEAPDIGPNSTLPMAINVVEATPRRFGFGAEYSTVEGIRLSGFWLHRNFLGGAERFRVDGSVAGIGGGTGGVDYDLGVRYERPAEPRADIDFFAEIGFESLDEPDFTSQTADFTLGFTRYATDDLTVEFGLGYLYSDSEDAFGRETYQLVTLPLAGELDKRDDSLDPTKGYYVDLEVTPFIGLAGTSGGAQTVLDARAYRGMGKLTFAGRMQLGSLLGPSLENSPPFYRFYSGGGGSVRGHGYQTLGVDFAGQHVGGRSFLGLSGELRGDITENIQLVGFADWGYVGAESFPDFTGDSHAGAGIGLRYKTGIGPIRLDLATPVSGETDGSKLYIYIGIGQTF